MTAGDTVTVRPISRKGANRVAEHGDRWTVVVRDADGVLLEAPDGYRRWVKGSGDPHLSLVDPAPRGE